MASVAVAVPGALLARDVAARSRDVLDRTLAHDVELTIATVADDAVLLGAFQRGVDVHADCTLFRRGSGGAAVRVGPGTLWVSLALARVDALVACTPDKIANRYVRPLLRALGRSGALAHFFGRDWISVAHRPAGICGFSHDRGSGRCAFEAFVAVTTPFALGPRESFLGKEPGTLAELTGKAIDPARVARAIGEAYAAGAPSFDLAPAPAGDPDLTSDPPWTATADEAIGAIAAGPDATGRLRVGGELLVSRDALAALAARLAAGEEAARAVDETLGVPGVALDGVRNLRSIADVIDRARARPG